MDQLPVAWSTKVEVADWLAQRLRSFDAYRVGSILPSGYIAYARILHPASRLEGNNHIKVRWAEIAARSGRVAHPQMQFEMISQATGEVAEPDVGSLTSDEAIELTEILRGSTTTSDRCWFCIWAGYGWFNEGGMAVLSCEGSAGTELPPIAPESVLTGPRVHLPGRDYLLYGGAITVATKFCGYPWYQTPNLWWPEDRAWCVASEIDLPCTYVGGDTQLIERLLSDGRIEALPARLTDGVTIGSDIVNG